jgi:hypothetical protein
MIASDKIAHFWADLSSISGISAAMVEGWVDDPGLVVE